MGKKTIYWLHFFNLPPLKQLQQIFVLYEAKVMIYWPKSGKNTKSWPHLFNFECKQKILEVTHALPKYTVVLSLHILLVWADLHVSWFSDDYPLCSFSCYSFCSGKSQVLSLLPLAWLSCSLLSNYR